MHVVVVVVVVVMMVMMMVHLSHRSGRSAGGGRGRFLRDGVAGEGDGESGGGGKALDHWQTILSRKTPAVFGPQSAGPCLNLR
jgi:uncharacterized membrane protein YgcG